MRHSFLSYSLTRPYYTLSRPSPLPFLPFVSPGASLATVRSLSAHNNNHSFLAAPSFIVPTYRRLASPGLGEPSTFFFETKQAKWWKGRQKIKRSQGQRPHWPIRRSYTRPKPSPPYETRQEDRPWSREPPVPASTPTRCHDHHLWQAPVVTTPSAPFVGINLLILLILLILLDTILCASSLVSHRLCCRRHPPCFAAARRPIRRYVTFSLSFSCPCILVSWTTQTQKKTRQPRLASSFEAPENRRRPSFFLILTNPFHLFFFRLLSFLFCLFVCPLLSSFYVHLSPLPRLFRGCSFTSASCIESPLWTEQAPSAWRLSRHFGLDLWDPRERNLGK